MKYSTKRRIKNELDITSRYIAMFASVWLSFLFMHNGMMDASAFCAYLLIGHQNFFNHGFISY